MAFVLLLVMAPVVGAAGAIQTSQPAQVAQPDGFAAVPDTNVVEDMPVQANRGERLGASDLEGSVMASQDASSLDVIVTTKGRAQEYTNGNVPGQAGSPGSSSSTQLALVLQDDQSHAGRQVAIPAEAIRQEVGRVPKVVHGAHEDGTDWMANVTRRNGLLIFEVPKFSSNTVTFEGEVRITADPGQDGSQNTYDVGNPDSVDQFTVDLTGVESTETETVSAGALASGDTFATNVAGTEPSTNAQVTFTGDGFSRSDNYGATGASLSSSQSIGIDGNLDPTDGSGGDPAVEVTANAPTQTYNPAASEPGSVIGQRIFIGDDSSDTGFGTEVQLQPDFSGTIDSISVGVDDNPSGSDYGGKVDVYLIGGSPDGTIEEGTQIATWDPSWSAGTQTINPGTDVSVSSGQTYTLAFKMQSTDNDGAEDWIKVGVNGEPETDWYYSGRYGYYYPSAADVTVSHYKSVDGLSVSDAQGASASIGSLNDGETVTRTLNLKPSSTQLDWSGSGGGTIDWTLTMTERAGSEDPSVDVDGDGITDASFTGVLNNGETSTTQVSNLPIGSGPASVSLTSGTVGADVTYTEHTVTRDPSVYVNGQETGYTGELTAGQSTSLSTNTSWVVDGSNNVTVTVGDGTLSSDAPTPSVAMNYSHTAEKQVDTTYTSTGWEESYNVSHTFAGDQQNAALRVPFSQEIHEIEHVEMSVNGGGWQSVPAEDWELQNGTKLVVQLDDGDGSPGVEGGDTIAVRTAGYKVNAVNGAVTVYDPTTPDDPNLDTGIRVDAKSAGFHIELGGTKLGDRVHYTHTESWSNPDERAVIGAGGSQELYLPNAQTGGDARMTTIPVVASPKSGDVGIQVADPDQIVLDVTPGNAGSGSEVEYTYLEAQAGETYGLYSLPRERYLDKADANSPVTLLDDDSEESLLIEIVDGSTDDGGTTSSGGGGSWEDPTEGIQLQEIAVLVSWAALVLVLVGATGRSDLRGRRRWLLVASVSVGSGLLALELLRPGSIAGAVSSGLSDIIGLAGIAAIGLTVYLVYNWRQTKKAEASTPDTKVTLDLGRNK